MLVKPLGDGGEVGGLSFGNENGRLALPTGANGLGVGIDAE